jgi:hypothetical protein
MGWLTDNLLVLLHSTRTQLALAGGVLSALLVLVYGQFQVDAFELSGPLSPLTQILKPYFMHRYEALAFIAFLTFLKLALRLFLDDRRRFL